MAHKPDSSVAVYLFFRDERGKILVALRQNTGYQDGIWQVPAGHADPGELPTEAAVREAYEEVGVRIKRQHLRLTHVSARPKHDASGNRLDYFFEVLAYSGKIKNKEPHKCKQLTWVNIFEIPKPMTPHVAKGMQEYLNGSTCSFSEITLKELKKMRIYGLK